MQTKKIIVFLSFTLFAVALKAQTQQHTSFGLRGGINFQNINGKNFNGDKLDNSMQTRFHIGANAEIPVAPDFYIQPGVLYTTKGAKQTVTAFGISGEEKVNLAYVEVPVNLLYKPVLGNGHLLLGFGPYIAFGVGGKAEVTGPNAKQTFDVKFKNTVSSSDPVDQAYFKPIDAGANLLVGYEFSNRFSAQLNAQLGLTKINPSYDALENDKSSWKNTGFGLSVGYRFN